MKSERSIKLHLSGFGNNPAALKQILDRIPDEGVKMDIHYSAGDRPWEMGSYTITFTWDEEL